jgi:hypothetical protein
MELSVTIELHEEEMRKFDGFIEDGCFDKTRYLKKMLLVGILQAAGAPNAGGSNGKPAGRMSGLD